VKLIKEKEDALTARRKAIKVETVQKSEGTEDLGHVATTAEIAEEDPMTQEIAILKTETEDTAKNDQDPIATTVDPDLTVRDDHIHPTGEDQHPEIDHHIPEKTETIEAKEDHTNEAEVTTEETVEVTEGPEAEAEAAEARRSIHRAQFQEVRQAI